MADKNIILMRGRFSNYSDYVKLVRGVVTHFVDNNRFIICSYDHLDREKQDLVVYDVGSYKFDDHGCVSGGQVTEEGVYLTIREATELGDDPSLVLVTDFSDHDNEEVMDYIDTEIGMKYVALLYYDKKNRPVKMRENKSIKLLNRFLRTEEMNRVHRRSCIIMKNYDGAGG